MNKITVFLFTEDFFKGDDQIKFFVKEGCKQISSKTTLKEMSKEALFQSFIANSLYKKCTDAYHLHFLKISEAHFLYFAGYFKDDPIFFEKGLEIISKIEAGKIENSLNDPFHLVKGELCLGLYLLRLAREEIDNNKTKQIKLLLEAKRHFSILLNNYFEDKLKIEVRNTQKVIVSYAEILGHLSRYVEPFFLLEKIRKQNTSYLTGVHLLQFSLLDAIRSKTCDSTNPLILAREQEAIRLALSSKNTDRRNFSTLKEKQREIREILRDYERKYEVTPKELKKRLHKADKNIKKLGTFERFIISNQLSLNEHSIYCNCNQSLEDDLQIESACDHTKNRKTKEFQLLLDGVKSSFNSVRKAYYRAMGGLQDSSKLQKSKYDSVSGAILLDPQVQELIDAFKGCFSILDKIAMGINAALGIYFTTKEKRNIHFNSFFGRREVRDIIDKESPNLYLIALYSLSQDLEKNSKYSEFSENKDWRNAMEHNQFYVVDDGADIDELKEEFPNVSFFVQLNEFQNKAQYFIYFCRSAIFTYVWAIRKLSIKWDKVESEPEVSP